MLNIEDIREQFPILKQEINKKPLVYFDNGATTQKPKAVIDAIVNYYTTQNANIHRGVHTLSRQATELFEQARQTVAGFIGATSSEIVFTAGTTDSINIVASGLDLPKGAEILVTHLEHHSNILPWQLWCERNEGHLKTLPIHQDGSLDFDRLPHLVNNKTKLVAITQVSNTLGVINPVKEIIATIKSINPNILVLVDGAQSVPHMAINVKDIGCDFFVFSGHKMYAPTGTGVLYGRAELLNSLRLSRTGGGTIKTVTFDHTDYVEGPLRLEPGTPNIEGVIALAEAVKFINSVGLDKIAHHEHTLLKYAQEKLSELPELEIYANHLNKAAVISFNVKSQHPYDVGSLLDKYGVAVRTGHHCTQPLMQYYGIPGTIRASFAMYNTMSEVDVFIESLKKSIRMLS